ncbi:MAG: DNA polymerase I, partial [Chthonomonadales bacterium]
GDTADNVPGVEGIGPKTAAELLKTYDTIEGIYEHIHELKGKRKENLEKAVATLPLSRTLVTLKREEEFPFTMDQARVSPPELPKMLNLFQQLGFNRYQDEVKKLSGNMAIGAIPLVGPGPVQASLFDTAPDEESTLASAVDGLYQAITTRAQLDELVATLSTQPILSVDTETTGLGRHSDLVGICLSWKAGEGVYIPVRSPEPVSHLSEAEVLGVLKPILENEAIKKTGHNLKFDAGVLLRVGISLQGAKFDSMLAMALIDPAQGSAKLDALAEKFLKYRMISINELIGDGSTQKTMADVPLSTITKYAAEDADIALQLRAKLLPTLEEMGMSELLQKVEAPLAVVLAEMEHNGIFCDPEELARQGRDLGARVDDLRLQIREAAGMDFDVNSPRQLAEVLFDKLGMKAGKKTKTGRSTDVEVLEKLASEEDKAVPHTAVPRLILEFRQLNKLITTYLGSLRDSIDKHDHRIHTTFHQLVTATGRLASNGPNLQNIPVRSDVGRQIRKAFQAPTGHVLMCADYSQVELRILAHLSGDPGLIRAFDEGQDIHTAVAAQVFGVAPADVTREMRNNAKTINFGIIYGVTPFGLSRRIEGMDVPTASKLIQDYKERFPGITTFLHECVETAVSQGYVTTILGRRRAIPEVRSTNGMHRALGERLAINTVVQGSGADLIKTAMVNLDRKITHDKLPMKMLLQIHDELVLEAPEADAPSLSKIVTSVMEDAMALRVPLVAEAGSGRDWYSAK